MFRNYIVILAFLFCVNTISQTTKLIKIIDDQKISDFLIEYDISPNDFFILNPNYSQSRFNYSSLDLEKQLKTGEVVTIFELIENNKSEKISFISHKIKRKQSVNEIASIYGVSKNLILKYNVDTEIKKNNTLQIPITINSKPDDRLKVYMVKPREGKWRIAYKYSITIEALEKINPDIGIVLKSGQMIAVPNVDEVEIKIIEENNNYFEVQKNIQIPELEKKLGLRKNSIIKLNPGILDNVEKGIIIKVPASTNVNEDVKNLSKKSLQENIIDFEKKTFAIILPFRLDNFDYDSIQKSTPILKNDRLLNLSLDFLFGAEMAVNYFSEIGIDVQMDVFDSALDKQKIDQIINNNNFEAYDFVVGPLTNSMFNYFIKTINESEVKIVRPLSKKQNNDRRIINTIPNDTILFNKIISHVKSDTIKSKKYIISDLRSVEISNKIKRIFPDAKQFYSKINESGDDTKTLVYDDLDSTFVKGKNIVFLETKEQGFVSNVSSILNSFINDTINIELVTTNKNNAFEGVNISNNYLSNLKFQYASTNKKIDLINDKFFIDKFISDYNYFPSKYSIRAYDIVYDLLLRISNGDLDEENLHQIETEYFENKFKYVRSSTGSIDNTAVYLIKHEDLKIKELP